MQPPLLIAILAAIGCGTRSEGLACLVVDDETSACPDPEDVDLDDLVDPADCDQTISEMVSTEAPTPGSGVFQDPGVVGCCYDVVSVDTTPGSECVVGRPFLEDGAPVLPSAPDVDDPVAADWLRLARMELASVGAFARLQLELLAHGAPMELVAGVVEAMRDEVDHARRLQRHAEARVGCSLPFGPMSLPAEVALQRRLADVAADAVREGCIGETLSAQLVARAGATAQARRLRADLAKIAQDEAKHAVLSWSIVAWAMRVGGPEVRQSVEAAFAAPVPLAAMVTRDGAETDGLLGPAASADVGRDVLRTIISPAARGLLGPTPGGQQAPSAHA